MALEISFQSIIGVHEDGMRRLVNFRCIMCVCLSGVLLMAPLFFSLRCPAEK